MGAWLSAVATLQRHGNLAIRDLGSRTLLTIPPPGVFALLHHARVVHDPRLDFTGLRDRVDRVGDCDATNHFVAPASVRYEVQQALMG